MRVYVCGQRSFGRAVLDLLMARGHEVVGVSSPLDRLAGRAHDCEIPWLPAGALNARTLPEDVDLLVAAHSHDFIGRGTRLRLRIGALGYHPSLLPLHRGRDAVRWTVRDRDRVAGGSVYWLNDVMDGGPIAAQDWCLVRPGDDASELWRRDLFPMGLRLFDRVLSDLEAGLIVRVRQDEACATFEPAMDPPPVFRPDLPELGPGGWQGFTVTTERSST